MDALTWLLSDRQRRTNRTVRRRSGSTMSRANWACRTSLNNMGLLYFHGTCVQRDYAVARQWFEQSSRARRSPGPDEQYGHPLQRRSWCPPATPNSRGNFSRSRPRSAIREARQNLAEMRRSSCSHCERSQGNIEFVDETAGLIAQLHIALQLRPEGLDQTRAKTSPRWYLRGRATVPILPGERQPTGRLIQRPGDIDMAGRAPTGRRTWWCWCRAR